MPPAGRTGAVGVDECGHLVGVEGLDEVFGGAGRDGPDGRVEIAEGRHHDHRRRGDERPEVGDRREAVAAREADVEKEELGREIAAGVERRCDARSDLHRMAPVVEELAEAPADRGFVVDDEDPAHG
jgi:hypothetical protein